MSDKEKHMPSYTSSDIEKYLSGDLTASEMHALELAALDDPFLADALEGIQSHKNTFGQPAFNEDMSILRQRLQDRVASKNIRRLPLAMRYAAVLILLAGLGMTAYFTFSGGKRKGSSLAKTEVRPEIPATPSPAAAADTHKLTVTVPPVTADTYSYTLSSKPASTSKEPSLSRSRPELSNSFYSKRSNAPAYSNTATQDYKLEKKTLNIPLDPRTGAIPDSITFYKDTLIPIARMGPHYDHMVSNQLVYTGKVINTQNIPLAGVSLSVKSDQAFNTVTDKNGYFTIRLPKKDSAARVLINYTGYNQENMALNTDKTTGNIILLQPQPQSMNEVVIEGYGSKRKEFTRYDINAHLQPLSEMVVPTDGWPSYKNYLELNKRSPTLDSLIRGSESISFLVNQKGELSSFKVENSLSPAHDSLTIRLIKEGPSWKLLSGKKERARVILNW